MSRFNFSEEDKQNIYNLYYNERKGIPTIASIYNCSSSKIRNLFINNNWQIRSVAEANSKTFTDEQKENIIRQYTCNNIGTFTLSKQYKCSEKAIQTVIKHSGIKLRTYVEAKQAGRKYQINDNYFKEQNHNMAYILGLIASDGNISKKENCLTIQLRNYDGEILEQIKNQLQSTRPIDYYTDGKGVEYAKLAVWSAEIKKDLAIYNLTPNKTFILQPPTFLNKKYWISFIRGYFDGDGSIYELPRTISWSIKGASKTMIEWIREVLATDYAITNEKIYSSMTDNGNYIYSTTYYGAKCEQLYKVLYVPNSLYLQRKKEKFSKLISPRDSTSSD